MDSASDPATRAAASLARCIRDFRDLLNDDGYAAVLPAIEALAAALPEPVVVPMPRRRPLEDHPMDRSIAITNRENRHGL